MADAIQVTILEEVVRTVTLPAAVGPTGPAGATGATGSTGAAGANGQGVPTGGTAGQILEKIDSTNYNTRWTSPSAGAVTSVNSRTGAITLSKSDVGLSNADNTADSAKPVSTAQAAADAAVQAAAIQRSNHTGTQTASTISDFSTAADARISAQKAQNNGLATLDSGGKVPTSQLPAIAITSTFVVNSQAAQLALTAEEGDIAVRTDLNKSYVHNSGSAGTMADWTELLTPTDTVISVNGQTGAVTLTTANIADSSNKRYVTDAQSTVLGNTSGTNTGDQTNITGNAGTVTTINGQITSGANVTITGAGTSASPYNIAAAYPQKVIAVVDFGDGLSGGTNVASVTVAASWANSTLAFSCDPLATATTDHDPEDYAVEQITAYVANIVDGVGFDVIASANYATWGKYNIQIIGV